MAEEGEGGEDTWRTYHDGEVIVVDAVVVDGGLQQVRVLFEPGWQLGGCLKRNMALALTHHLGRLMGFESILRSVVKCGAW